MFVLEHDDRELWDRVHEQNLNRQYELLTNCIEIGLKKGPMSFVARAVLPGLAYRGAS